MGRMGCPGKSNWQKDPLGLPTGVLPALWGHMKCTGFPLVSPEQAALTCLDVCFSSQSMHQQQQLQHQQFQKELERIQLLHQQQLPFHAPGDVAQDAELPDSSGLYSESSGTSSPSMSPRASNHSLHSSSSASRTGAGPFLEQDDEGKASCCLVLFALSSEYHLRDTAP